MQSVVANLSGLPPASMPRTPSTRARCPAETVIGGAAIVRRPGEDATDVEAHDVAARGLRAPGRLRAGPGSRRATRCTRLPAGAAAAVAGCEARRRDRDTVRPPLAPPPPDRSRRRGALPRSRGST